MTWITFEIFLRLLNKIVISSSGFWLDFSTQKVHLQIIIKVIFFKTPAPLIINDFTKGVNHTGKCDLLNGVSGVYKYQIHQKVCYIKNSMLNLNR